MVIKMAPVIRVSRVVLMLMPAAGPTVVLVPAAVRTLILIVLVSFGLGDVKHLHFGHVEGPAARAELDFTAPGVPRHAGCERSGELVRERIVVLTGCRGKDVQQLLRCQQAIPPCFPDLPDLSWTFPWAASSRTGSCRRAT